MAQGENFLVGSANPLTSVSWAETQVTKTASNETSPVAGFTACDLVDNAVNVLRSINQVPGGVDPYALDDKARFSVACLAKAQNRDWLILVSGANSAWFDLANGQLGNTANVQNYMTALGNGWYLCGMWLNFGVRFNFLQSVFVAPANANGVASYVGDGTVAITIAAPHVVKANYPEPLFPTAARRKVGPIQNSLKGPQI